MREGSLYLLGTLGVADMDLPNNPFRSKEKKEMQICWSCLLYCDWLVELPLCSAELCSDCLIGLLKYNVIDLEVLQHNVKMLM